VRTSNAVLFTRRWRENGRLFAFTLRSRDRCNFARDHRRDHSRSITRHAPRRRWSSDEIRHVHQSSPHCRSHSPIAPVDYAQFTR